MDSPVNADIEVKIGKESTKQIVEMVADVFSPVTELLGALGDNIRVYRTNAVLRTFEKTRKLAEKSRIQLKAPPVKFLVPFIEEASLEEDNSEITDLWAKLLYSASSEYDDYHRTFIDVVGQLTPSSAKLLEKFLNSSGTAEITPGKGKTISHKEYVAREADLEEHIYQDIINSKDDRHIMYINYLNTTKYKSILNIFGTLVRAIEIGYRNKTATVLLSEQRWESATNGIPDDIVRIECNLLDRLGLINNRLNAEWKMLSLKPNDRGPDIYFRVLRVSVTEYGRRFLEAVTDNTSPHA